MQLSIRIICDRSIAEAVKQQVNALTNYLNLSNDHTFLPYWKDERCVISELSTDIEDPDYSKIQQYIKSISGTENIILLRKIRFSRTVFQYHNYAVFLCNSQNCYEIIQASVFIRCSIGKEP